MPSWMGKCSEDWSESKGTPRNDWLKEKKVEKTAMRCFIQVNYIMCPLQHDGQTHELFLPEKGKQLLTAAVIMNRSCKYDFSMGNENDLKTMAKEAIMSI